MAAAAADKARWISSLRKALYIAASCGVLEPSVWHRAIGAVFPVLCDGDCAKGAISVGFLSVLIELLGETVHMVTLNASRIGALLVLLRDRVKTKCNKKD